MVTNPKTKCKKLRLFSCCIFATMIVRKIFFRLHILTRKINNDYFIFELRKFVCKIQCL